MIVSLRPSKKESAALALLDCMVFMAIFSLLLSMSFVAFARFETQSKRLRQNAGDIAQAVKAGEMWREDIRVATAKIQLEKQQERTALHIPQATGTITYLFDNSTVSRRRDAGVALPILTNVQVSLMELYQRKHVAAWSWEIELKAREKQPKVRPQFSFQAVVSGDTK